MQTWMQKERPSWRKHRPEAQAFCQKQGLMLEATDVRWGISELVDPDHRNTQLSLEETEACQKLLAGLTFVVSATTTVLTQSLWLK
uniref:Uncharacterized protein n=1 Tax=Strigops habroptila TaxID=2489341 RepID=A0A672V618_STRHB